MKNNTSDLLSNQFTAEIQRLGGEAIPIDLLHLPDKMSQEIEKRHLKRIAACIVDDKIRDSLEGFPDFRNWNWLHMPQVQNNIRSDPPGFFARIDVGVVSADFFIANIGSTVLGRVNNISKLISLVPPTIILIGWKNQILPDLQALFHGVGKGVSTIQEWNHLTLITGPSRTADIEKTLILGVHGPKTVLCMIVDG